MIYSKGISWLDDTRIPFVDETILLKGYTGDKWKSGEFKENRVEDKLNTQGRFTPNLLVSDDMLNDGNMTETNTKGQVRSEKRNWVYTGENKNNRMNNIKDKGSNSRYYDIDLWFNELIYGLQ